MAQGSDVLAAGKGLRDALFNELQSPGLSTAAFDAIGAEHLRAVQAVRNFQQSPASALDSASYDPVLQSLNAAAADVAAMNPQDPNSLHNGLASSDAAVVKLVAITT